MVPHSLPQRLQGLERIPRLAACRPTHSHVKWSTATKTWARPLPVVTVVVMSVPHIVVRLLGDDRAVMGLRAVGVAAPPRGLEVVLPHQPPDPLGGGADPLTPQAGPDLAVALAMERALGQDPADVADQLLVRGRPDRATLPGHGPLIDRDRLSGLEIIGAVERGTPKMRQTR